MTHTDKLPTFYELGFAAQMIVWATRKRLHLAASGAGDENAREAFRVGKLDTLYAALMSIVDVLSCGASRSIQLHAVSCPHLAPHEVGMLDALAHLQAGRKGLAYQRIVEVFGTVVARFVWQSMCAVVNELNERDLLLEPINVRAPSTAWEQRPNATVH